MLWYIDSDICVSQQIPQNLGHLRRNFSVMYVVLHICECNTSAAAAPHMLLCFCSEHTDS